jgi:hypothetical protein
MRGLYAMFVLSLPLAGLAGSFSFSGLRSRPRHSSLNMKKRNEPFQLKKLYEGQNFFDDWDFFTQPDPTNGLVVYQSREDAFKKKLAFVQPDNTVVLAVDNSTFLGKNEPRASVRISTKDTFNGGLFIADIYAMPHGCSTWPAYWSVSSTAPWPNGGEIDVIEGVHNSDQNSMTLHTGPGCRVEAPPIPDDTNKIPATLALQSKLQTPNCDSSRPPNTGCSFLAQQTDTYGQNFNVIAGGIYAHLWQPDSIKIWYFPRCEIPDDILIKRPDPSTWPAPIAVFNTNQCDIPSHFHDHQLIFDITLCGDLAGATYGAATECTSKFPTCADAVMDPSNFQTAQWKIGSVAVYQ